MPATSKRPAFKAAPPMAVSPVLNAALIGGSLAYGVWLLVQGGRLTWPPGPLLAGAYTVAGCLGLVGPVVLARGQGDRDRSQAGLGEVVWMTGGLLIWAFDLAALATGEWRQNAWATPLGVRAMGLTALAVMVSGWRLGRDGRSWQWTNVLGWGLGLFWIVMGLATLWPGGNPLMG